VALAPVLVSLAVPLKVRSAWPTTLEVSDCGLIALHRGERGAMKALGPLRFIPAVAGMAFTAARGMAEKTAESKYFLCDLPAKYSLRRLAQVAKSRWKIEQDYQQLNEELGLDHYEGRSLERWHHHVTLVMLAHSLLPLETLRKKLLAGPCQGCVVRFSGCFAPGQARAATAAR